ncbi:ATR-interacting protein isoform X2 [Narcine bancroftii]
MSSNSLFINSGKKRNTSIIYSVENLPSDIPVPTFSELSNQGRKNISHESDGFPPNKRHKGEQAKDARANEDPFGDHEDFTADDLKELDILASQVLVQDMKPVSNAMIASVTDKNNKGKSVVKNDANTKTATFSTRAINCENEGKELHENGVIHCKNADSFGFEVLQEQHNKLRLQFNEVQEELQIKSGEIKILRDCLRRVESELDQQKRLHLLSEKEKNEAQSQREKEFSKKVQSLESELQFKEAEMNELRIKLKSCERTTKSPVLGVAKVRKSSSGSTASPQIARNYFPDKRSFGAEKVPVQSVDSASTANQLSVDEEPRDLRELHIANKEIPEKSPSLNSIRRKVSHRRQSKGSADSHCICTGEGKQVAWSKADLQTATRLYRGRIEGAVLMTMLLSQPVGLQSLGLSHLLNCSSETFIGLVQHHSCCSIDSSSTEKTSEVQIKEISSNLNKFQQLALCGINMLSLDQELSENNLDSTEISLRLRNQNGLPGAVHLLPLIEYFLDSFCKSLQIEKAGSPSRCCSSSSGEHTTLNINDCVHNLEDFALAALGVLYRLVSHSQKVGNTLLVHSSSQSPEGASCSAAQRDDQRMSPVNHDPEVGASWIQKDFVKLQESAGSEESQNHLFNKLLHLSDPASINISRRRENVQYQSLRVLGKVAESASPVLLHRFHHLLSSQVLLRSLSPDSSCSVVQLVVQLLTNLADHVELASRFCSQSAACHFLNLYMYASSRPDSSATDVLWLQLEQEIIRFITKFSLSHPGAIAVLVESDCPCNTEIFKTLIVMLHRQWLNIRKSTQNLCSLGNQAVVQFLRETVMLLHCLSQRDKNFTDHCFVVLHLYDQVMHGIKAIFKKLPDLEENEEIALEELCSPEPEVEYPALETDGP